MRGLSYKIGLSIQPNFTSPLLLIIYSNVVCQKQTSALSEQGVDTTEITSELEKYQNFLSEESKKAETYEAEATHLAYYRMG